MRGQVTDSLKRMKRIRLACLLGACALLAALIIYGVLRPSPEEKEYNRLHSVLVEDFAASGTVIEDEFSGMGVGAVTKQMDKQQREELRKSFDKLSPATKEKLTTEIMRAHLQKAREALGTLTEQQKVEQVDKMIEDAKKHFNKMSPGERERTKADLSTPEGKKRVSKSLQTYNSEFSAKERELLDPLVEEILIQINAL